MECEVGGARGLGFAVGANGFEDGFPNGGNADEGCCLEEVLEVLGLSGASSEELGPRSLSVNPEGLLPARSFSVNPEGLFGARSFSVNPEDLFGANDGFELFAAAFLPFPGLGLLFLFTGGFSASIVTSFTKSF